MKMNLILLAPPLCVFVCVFLLCLVNVLKCKLALLNNVCKAEEKLQLRWQTLDMPLLTNLHTDSLSVRLSVWSPRRLLQPHFSIPRQQSASFSSSLLTHVKTRLLNSSIAFRMRLIILFNSGAALKMHQFRWSPHTCRPEACYSSFPVLELLPASEWVRDLRVLVVNRSN